MNTFRRSNDKKLSGGVIAAIVLSCVVVLSIIIGIIYLAKNTAVVKAPYNVPESKNNLES